MSFLTTIVFHGINPEMFSHWLQAMVYNLPMAVFFQFFFMGPFVRMIFRGVFGLKSSPAGLSNKRAS